MMRRRMNTLVKIFRDTNPSFGGSDDEILDQFSKRRPDLIQAYPDALTDWQALQTKRQQAVDEVFPAGVKDKAKTVVSNLVRGAADTVASSLTGIAALGKAAQDNTLGTTPPIEENFTYQLGQKVRSAGRAVTPDPDPRISGSFAYETVPQAIGSSGVFLAGGVAAGGSKAAIAGLGALAGAGGGYEDARQSGATEGQAQLSALLNGVVGTSEALPLGDMLGRLNGISGNRLLPEVLGSFTSKLTKRFGHTAVEVTHEALKETFEEALQEGFQGVSGNLIASEIAQYDKERNILQGVGEQAGAGGVSGFVLSLLSSAIGRHRGAKVPSKDGAPEIKADPELPTAGAAAQAFQTPNADSPDLALYTGGISDARKAELLALAQRDLAGGLSLLEQDAITRLEPQDRNQFVLYRSELASQPPAEQRTAAQIDAEAGLTDAPQADEEFDLTQFARRVADPLISQDQIQGSSETQALDSSRPVTSAEMNGESGTSSSTGIGSSAGSVEAGNLGAQPLSPAPVEIGLGPASAVEAAKSVSGESVVSLPLTTNPAVVNETAIRETQTEPSVVAPSPTEVTSTLDEYAALNEAERTISDRLSAANDRISPELKPSKEDIAQAKSFIAGLTEELAAVRERIDALGHPTQATPEQLLALTGVVEGDNLPGRRGQVLQGEGGVGKKNSAAFTLTNSWDVIFQEASALRDKVDSRKLAMLEAPNGTYVVASAINAPKRTKGKMGRENLIQTPDGNKTSEQLELLGYRPIASLKLKRPAKRFWTVYNETEAKRLVATATQQTLADIRSAAAVEEQLQQAGSGVSDDQEGDAVAQDDFSKEPIGPLGQRVSEGELDKLEATAEEDYRIIDRAKALSQEPAFTADEATAAYNLFADDVKAGGKIPSVAKETAEHEALESVRLKEAVRLIESGEYSTEQEVRAAAVDRVAAQIQEAYAKYKDRRGFTRYLQAIQSGEQRLLGQVDGSIETPEVRFRQLHYGRRSDTIGTANTAFQRILAAAYSLGWRVELYQRTINALFDPFFQREGGAIQYANRGATIALTMNSVANPSAEDARTLMHELAHGMADTLFPVALKQQILDGIDTFTDAELGIETSRARTAGNPDERLAEHLANQGLEQQVSQSVARRIFQYLAELFLRGALAVQRMLGIQASPAFAREYVGLRMQRLLNGDSVLAYFGGPEMSAMSKASVYTPSEGGGWSGINMVLDPATMQMAADPVLPDSTHEALFNLSQQGTRRRNVDDRTLSPDRTNDDVIAETVTPNNEVMAWIETMYAKLPTRDQFTLDEFVAQMVNRGLIKEDPRSVIQAFAERASATIGRQIDTSARISSIPSEMVRKRSMNIAYQIMERAEAKLRAGVMDAGQELSGAKGSLQDRLYKNATRLNTLINQKENMQVLMADAKALVIDELQRARKDFKRIATGVIGIRGRAVVNEVQNRSGKLAQIYDELAGTTPDPVLQEQFLDETQKFIDALDGSAFQGRFANVLRTLSSRGVDLSARATDVRDAIRALNDPLFAEFTADTVPSRARLAALVSLGGSPISDLLVINASSALQERQKINGLLKIALSGRATALNEALAEARKLPELGVRLGRVLGEIAKTERQQRAIRDRLLRNQELLEFADNIGFHQLAAAKAPLEQALGIETQTYWEAVNGATIRVPAAMRKDSPALANKLDPIKDPSLKKQPVRWSYKANRNSGEQAELQSVIQGIGRWLNSVPKAERNVAWNDMAAIRIKLLKSESLEVTEPVKASAVTKVLGSKADQLDQTGEADARRMARRIRDIATLEYSWRDDWHIQGNKWSSAEGAAIKALGFSGRQQALFRDLFYNRIIGFLERRGDLAAASGDNQGIEDALKAARQWLVKDTITARRMASNPSAWPKIEALLRQTFEANATALRFQKEAGLKVEENYRTANGDTVYRHVLGDSRFEVPRGIKESIFDMADRMKKLGWLDFSNLSADKVGAALDDGSLGELLNRITTPEIQQQFLREMALNPGESLFNAPRIDSPYWKRASTAATAEAWESSNGTIPEFIDKLFALETQGQQADQREFAIETIQTIQNYFKRLHGVMQERENARKTSAVQLGQLMMNARISNSFPSGWLQYHTFDTRSMQSASRQAALQASLGHELSGWESNLESSARHFSALDNQLAELNRRADELGGNRNATLKRLAEAAGGPGHLSYLENASKNLSVVRSADSFLKAYIEGESGINDSIRPVTQLVNAGIAHVLQGPASAFVDTVSVFQPLLHSGPSWGSIKYVAKTAKAAANEFVQPYLQIAGLAFKYDAEFQARKELHGFVDTSTQVTTKQVMRAIINETDTIPGWTSRNVTRLARIVRAIPSLGIDAKIGSNQGYQTAKGFWGIFTQMGFALRTGAAYGTIETYKDAVSRAVQFYDNPARTGQLNDPGHRVTAEDIGYTDRILGINTGDNFFKHLTGKLDQYATSLDGLAKDYIQRRSVDPQAPLITDDLFRRLAFLGANEITMDSSLANRSPIFVNNSIMRLAMPLLGWSVEQAASFGRNYREVGGAKSVRAFNKGLLGMAALLPVAFTYALLRDEYDEEILGKKADRKNVFETNGSPGAIGLATADMLSRVGTFGILGDVGTSFANFYGDLDNRGVSLDNRVYFVNSMMGAARAFSRWAGQGFNGSYATTGRPAIQALGGSGYLQWLQIANNFLDADNAESRVTTRINAQNYLRASGRALGLDVRSASGGASAPTKLKPAVSDMALAALANDAGGFQAAYREALAIARDQGSDNPEDTVRRSFQYSHPLRLVFRTLPSEQEFAKLLGTMDRTGQRSVSEAVRLFNFYGEQIGLKPSNGRSEATASPRATGRSLIGAGLKGLGGLGGLSGLGQLR
jgi:hypothetical protein